MTLRYDGRNGYTWPYGLRGGNRDAIVEQCALIPPPPGRCDSSLSWRSRVPRRSCWGLSFWSSLGTVIQHASGHPSGVLTVLGVDVGAAGIAFGLIVLAVLRGYPQGRSRSSSAGKREREEAGPRGGRGPRGRTAHSARRPPRGTASRGCAGTGAVVTPDVRGNPFGPTAGAGSDDGALAGRAAWPAPGGPRAQGARETPGASGPRPAAGPGEMPVPPSPRPCPQRRAESGSAAARPSPGRAHSGGRLRQPGTNPNGAARMPPVPGSGQPPMPPMPPRDRVRSREAPRPGHAMPPPRRRAAPRSWAPPRDAQRPGQPRPRREDMPPGNPVRPGGPMPPRASRLTPPIQCQPLRPAERNRTASGRSRGNAAPGGPGNAAPGGVQTATPRRAASGPGPPGSPGPGSPRPGTPGPAGCPASRWFLRAVRRRVRLCHPGVRTTITGRGTRGARPPRGARPGPPGARQPPGLPAVRADAARPPGPAPGRRRTC